MQSLDSSLWQAVQNGWQQCTKPHMWGTEDVEKPWQWSFSDQLHFREHYINVNVPDSTSVPSRVTLKVAPQMWASPPWQLALTSPQLAAQEDSWEPLPHLEARLLGPEESGEVPGTGSALLRPVIVYVRCNKYPQHLFPERMQRDKYYEGLD